MKHLLEWRLERLLEYAGASDSGISAPQDLGTQSNNTGHLDPNVLRIIQKVVPQVRGEFQDPQDAIEAIALACIVALNDLGRSESIEKIKRVIENSRGYPTTRVPQ